jgi:hypothetical protein
MIKTPPEILEKFEQAAQGLDYGLVSLTLHMKMGKPRYIVSREESFIPADENTSTENAVLKKI